MKRNKAKLETYFAKDAFYKAQADVLACFAEVDAMYKAGSPDLNSVADCYIKYGLLDEAELR